MSFKVGQAIIFSNKKRPWLSGRSNTRLFTEVRIVEITEILKNAVSVQLYENNIKWETILKNSEIIPQTKFFRKLYGIEE